MVKSKPTKSRRKGFYLSKRHVLLSIFLIIFTSVIFLAAVLSIYAAILIKDLPSPQQLTARRVSESTKLYDRTGKVLLYEIHGEEKRTVIPFEEIPEFLKKATLAAEDANFYNQPAFNFKAIIRALLINLKEGRISQGGSTITQQLARNAFLSRERTLTRKLKELILAIGIESKFSKDEILSLYLNQIPYGSNAYGVEAASLTYFNKRASELTLGEAAIIAALPKAPSFYSPWGSHKEELFKRRDYILERMVELGFITEEEKKKAQKEEIVFAPPSLGKILAPHFSLTVRGYLENRYGEDMLLNGGLKVITTLDWEMQQIAERLVKEGAKRNEELYAGRNAALVAQDPKTGQILALVGSRDYFEIENEGNFNVAMQALRQPGSALKPFAYLIAFKKGYHPKTKIFDVPTEFKAQDSRCPAVVDFSNKNDECFHPQNFDNSFRGPVTFEEGLAHSINVPSVKVLYLAGFDDVLSTIHKFGINTLKEKGRYGLSLILGGGEVKLIELVGAYATLAQEGVRHEQSFIIKVEDSKGKVLEDWSDKSKRVFEEEYVRIVNQILSDKDLRAGLFQRSLSLTVFPEREVALKTGTTNDYRDAWAIGYTPSLVVGVWAGNNDNRPMERRGSSILAAVPIWSEFMKEVLDNYPPETFTRPELGPPANKPMLNGNIIYAPQVLGKTFPQIHSILFYVKKDDPLGQKPLNPEDDPQFYNWETAVINWARVNVSNFSAFNLPLPASVTFEDYAPQSRAVTINIISPSNGSFVNLPLRVAADIKAENGLSKIELYLNRKLTNSFNVGGKFYHYEYYLLGPIDVQNLIELKATDILGNERTVSVIVFR